MRPRKLDTEKRSRETVVLFTTKERAAIEVKEDFDPDREEPRVYDFGRRWRAAQSRPSAPEVAFPKTSTAITKIRVKRISGSQKISGREFETHEIKNEK